MSIARNPDDQERLIDYVRVALGKLDAGEEVDAAALCHEHPQLALPLAEVLGLSKQLPLLQQMALREDPLTGAVLSGRYRLTTCLGRGAMGVVYAGLDQELGREVAVKILDVRLFRDPEAERRFQREAEALALLQHPHVVAVFDRGLTPEGIHFLVMERLHGVTVAQLLEAIAAGGEPVAVCAELLQAAPAEALWPRQCARWARDLALGLQVAHTRQLVHRDVKPSNVFLAQPGRAVLLDFGIASRATDQRLTATQTTLGTPWYMAPEQVRSGGLTTAEPTLDIYGLGALLYHMLAGRAPYVGDAATVLAALPTHDPTPLATVRSGLPRDLVAIVECCLEREPSRRYRTAARLGDDLDAFLQHLPVQARPISALGRRLRAWRRAPAWPLAIAATVTAVLVAAIALPFVWQQQAAARAQAKLALEVALPSLLAIEGWPEERVLAELGDEHRAGIAQLDHILELDPGDLAARLMRGCLWLDVGDVTRAASDLDRLARTDASPYLRELAKRYSQVQPDSKGVRTVALTDLPEPVTAKECFVAGFHELRNSHVDGFAARADALLLRATPTYPPARAQRLFSLAALAERAAQPAKAVLSKTLYDETVALEAEFGRATARTTAMRGVALLLQKRYRECVPEFEQSLALRAQRHGPHHNLGVALRRLHRLDEADRHLQQALALRPFSWNTKFTMAQLAMTRGNFVGAYAIAASMPKTGERFEAARQPDLVGTIAIAESVWLLATDPVAAKAAAGCAVAAYDEALLHRVTPDAQLRREMAVALYSDDHAAALVPFATAMMGDPVNAYQIANLAFLMPDQGLDAKQAARLQAFLRKLARELADGDETFGAKMDAEIKQGLARRR